MAMACSAVVIELPNGVFITMTPRAVAAGISTLSTPMPARPTTLRRVGPLQHLRRDLGGGTHRQPVELADDRGELVLVLAEVGLEMNIYASAMIVQILEPHLLYGLALGRRQQRCSVAFHALEGPQVN